MADKTRLELELEQRERHRTPAGIRIFVVILIVGLCAVGFYAFHLKQELLKKEQEAILLHEYFQKEQVELLGQIKKLEAAYSPDKSN